MQKGALSTSSNAAGTGDSPSSLSEATRNAAAMTWGKILSEINQVMREDLNQEVQAQVEFDQNDRE